MSDTQNDLLVFGSWLQVALIAVPALICAAKLEWDEFKEHSHEWTAKWHLGTARPAHGL